MDDVEEIRRLLYDYAGLIDDGNLAGVADLFSEGSIVGPDGTECHGRDNVLALYERNTRIYAHTGTPCTQHVTTNVAIRVDTDGDHAEAISCFTVFQALEDFPLQAIIAGRYEDRFARRGGEWAFLSRRIQPRLLGDLSRHLLNGL